MIQKLACGRLTMTSQRVLNFMKQQGFPEEGASTCDLHFAGLNFQPQIVGTFVVVGIVLHSPVLFLVLSVLLWWAPLVPAPGPRRFAQGMAGTTMLIVGFALLQGWTTTAWVFEPILVVAIAAL